MPDWSKIATTACPVSAEAVRPASTGWPVIRAGRLPARRPPSPPDGMPDAEIAALLTRHFAAIEAEAKVRARRRRQAATAAMLARKAAQPARGPTRAAQGYRERYRRRRAGRRFLAACCAVGVLAILGTVLLA